MKKINVTIRGTAPLLMNRFNMENALEQAKGKRVNKTYDPQEEAAKSAYWSSGKKKELMIPAYCIYACILNASSWYKYQKRSAKSVIAGSLRIEPDEVGLGTDKYEIDLRPVVIQRARVLKARPVLKKWEATFTIVYNDKMINDTTILRQIIEEAGSRIGLLDWRHAKGGMFGGFEIIDWEEE